MPTPTTTKLIVLRNMSDGLYRVDYPAYGICGGVEVRGGEVVKIAPVLVKNWNRFWCRMAERIGD